jgi:hypothetical protein
MWRDTAGCDEFRTVGKLVDTEGYTVPSHLAVARDAILSDWCVVHYKNGVKVSLPFYLEVLKSSILLINSKHPVIRASQASAAAS